MDDQKQQITDKLRTSKNVLVTVSADPSVDQLSACIALTLLLNKLDKHATAVYSGKTPSTIEFLQPEETIEKNTDSLRDFIIALDKAKADKLRYKVEEQVVKIFITPYKTSLSDKDLQFSQGDFNVDVVVALGVHRQQDLDAAITAHGRILHDATVVTINNTPNGDLGTIHWQDLSASSLSELVTSLATDLSDSVLDGQIATALLTGIVAETERFRNNKTTPRTMSISAELMAVGANQQLVAEQLEDRSAVAEQPTVTAAQDAPTDDAGSLEIVHPEVDPVAEISQQATAEQPEPAHEASEPAEVAQNSADEDSQPKPDDQEPVKEPADEKPQDEPANEIVVVPPEAAEPQPAAEEAPAQASADLEAQDQAAPPVPNVPAITGLKAEGDSAAAMPGVVGRNNTSLVTQPPAMGGVLTANSRPEALDPATEQLTLPPVNAPLLNREDKPSQTGTQAFSPPNNNTNEGPLFTPPVVSAVPPTGFEPTMAPEAPALPAPFADKSYDNETLTEIEQTVHHDEAQPVDPAPAAEAAQSEANSLDTARQEVQDAFNAAIAGTQTPLEPVSNLNWQGEVAVQEPASVSEAPVFSPTEPTVSGPIVEAAPLNESPADQPLTMPLPPAINLPPANLQPPTSSPNPNPLTPPPVPPPMPMMQPYTDPNRPSQL